MEEILLFVTVLMISKLLGMLEFLTVLLFQLREQGIIIEWIGTMMET